MAALDTSAGDGGINQDRSGIEGGDKPESSVIGVGYLCKKGAPPTEYTTSGGYRSGAAGGSGEGPSSRPNVAQCTHNGLPVKEKVVHLSILYVADHALDTQIGTLPHCGRKRSPEMPKYPYFLTSRKTYSFRGRQCRTGAIP